MTKLLKMHLERVRHMKNQADKGRTERVFQVGDWVYLKLQPYIQSFVERRANHKLSFKFYGPYQILQRVGEVAYKLQLPETSKIHPVVHVSQLKKSVPSTVIVEPTLPQATRIPQMPERILAKTLASFGEFLYPGGPGPMDRYD
jgi:hypothetical protein